MQHDMVFQRQLDTPSVAPADRHRRDTQSPMDTQVTDPSAWRTWTLTASLLAARREFDGSITLAIADPDAPSQSKLVAFPGPIAPITADPCLGQRAEQSRTAFLADFVDPSAEGFDLLYGAADLTLAEAADGSDSSAGLPVVVDFTALGGPPRVSEIARCCHHFGSQPTHIRQGDQADYR